MQKQISTILGLAIIFVVALVAVVGIVVGVRPLDKGGEENVPSIVRQPKPEEQEVPAEPEGVMCTMEVKECPDGSFVGRSGPKCEFAPCPGIDQKDPGISPQVSPENNSGLPNPASVNCAKKGGRLDIRTDKDGGQAGYCIFDNGQECEEWSLYRGECSYAN